MDKKGQTGILVFILLIVVLFLIGGAVLNESRVESFCQENYWGELDYPNNMFIEDGQCCANKIMYNKEKDKVEKTKYCVEIK